LWDLACTSGAGQRHQNAQVEAPLSLAPQEKVRLDLTFPVQLTLGPQTPAGAVEFLCDFDVTLESTP
jgi:hypothetical protein